MGPTLRLVVAVVLHRDARARDFRAPPPVDDLVHEAPPGSGASPSQECPGANPSDSTRSPGGRPAARLAGGPLPPPPPAARGPRLLSFPPLARSSPSGGLPI